jgi:hypothetical protein
MAKVGREIMEGKGLCLTCHTIGKTGALRFPDLAGVDVRAKTRVPGLNDVEYFAQSMYEPRAYVVEGFPPAMPEINKPPIGLTDQEILCVIAYLQTLGGTPTVTLQTKHHYNSGAAAPGAAQPPASAPKGSQLRPDGLQPFAAHEAILLADARERAEGVRRVDQPPLKLWRSAGAEAKAEARQGEGGSVR